MGKEYNRSVGYRSKKRKFYGRKKDDSSLLFDGKSASAKKLQLNSSKISDNLNDSFDGAVSNKLHGFRIVDVGILFKEICQHLQCKICQSPVNVLEENVRGSSSVFTMICSCESVKKINSCPMLGNKKTVPEINLRLVYTMRCLGKGLAGLKTFCAVMNMPPPISQKSYDSINKKIKSATQVVAENTMRTAAAEEVEITGSSDISVSGDGSWKTRGHTSKIGVCSVIGLESGKVIDVEVLSSFCKSCERSEASSDHECQKDHAGSSGAMEVIGMQRIFLRSEDNRKARYVKYLGDGDSKTFLNLSKASPYGEAQIEKLECVGHVQKRMGTRLRKLKQQLRGSKLPDGKTLGGKGRLTDSLIDKLTVYYGKAIRSNTHSLKSMREAVWATYCHMSSTDEEPMHMFCPKGNESWCKFQRHAANSDIKSTFHHKSAVPIEVMKRIKSVYVDLSAPNLLKRCLSGKTQNANESFNAVIWKFCPKTSGSGKTVAQVAVYEAVIAFNEGSGGRLNTLLALGINPGLYASAAAKLSDTVRICTAEKRADFRTLEARRNKRMQDKIKNDCLEDIDGPTYKSGEF